MVARPHAAPCEPSSPEDSCGRKLSPKSLLPDLSAVLRHASCCDLAARSATRSALRFARSKRPSSWLGFSPVSPDTDAGTNNGGACSLGFVLLSLASPDADAGKASWGACSLGVAFSIGFEVAPFLVFLPLR